MKLQWWAATEATETGASCHSGSSDVLPAKPNDSKWSLFSSCKKKQKKKQTLKESFAVFMIVMRGFDPPAGYNASFARSRIRLSPSPVFQYLCASRVRPSRPPARLRSDDKGHIETTNVTGNLDLFWAIIAPPRRLLPASPAFGFLWASRLWRAALPREGAWPFKKMYFYVNMLASTSLSSSVRGFFRD